MGDSEGVSEGSWLRAKYEIFEVLGRGAADKEGNEVAIKKVPLARESKSAVENEISLMKMLDCEYFVRLLEDAYMEDEDEMWMVQEFCHGGSLADVMEHCGVHFNEEQIRWALFSVTSALCFLHARSRIHRDVKAANILLEAQGRVKLTDLGVAALLDEKTQSRQTSIGSPYWMAPEVIQKSSYGVKADIWSLGITAIELAEGAPPMQDVHPFRALFLIPSQPPPSLSEESTGWSDDFRDFLQSCLMKDPEARPTAEELLKHPFLKCADKESLTDLCNEVIEKMEAIRQSFVEKETSKSCASPKVNAGNGAGQNSDSASGDDSSCGSIVKYDEAEADEDDLPDGSLVISAPQTSKSSQLDRECAYQKYVEQLRMKTVTNATNSNTKNAIDKQNEEERDSTT